MRSVTTGGPVATPIMDTVTAPQWLGSELTRWAAARPRSVLVLDLGDARWEAETLLELFASTVRAVHDVSDGDVVLVVSTSQPSVAQVARMVATSMDVSLYVADSASIESVADAAPAGRLTTSEWDTLSTIGRMGGRVTVSEFASRNSLEVTAAGNRLANLAKRGYVNRIARSRRQGDEFVSPAWFHHRTTGPLACTAAEVSTPKAGSGDENDRRP